MSVFALGVIFVFLVGICFGSFANVVVIRLRAASSLWGRSRCVDCGAVLRPHHLVPIFSWLWLRGRCASCHKPIHIQYPVVELIVGLLFVVAFVRHGISFSFIFESVLAWALTVCVTFDLRWRLLPIEFMAGLGGFFAAWNIWTGTLFLSSVAFGILLGVGFFGLQFVLSRGRWIGMGDIWLGGMIGAAFGWPFMGAVLYSTYIIGACLVLLLWLFRQVKPGSRVPFAPFLALGSFVTLWFGSMLLPLIGLG